MLSSSNLMAAPLYLELAPPEEAATEIDHLIMFRDTGVLSAGGRGRFATDLFTLSVTRDHSGGARVLLAPPRSGFTPRPRPFHGVVAGLRLSSRPKHLPDSKGLDMLAAELARVQIGDDDLPALIAVLEVLARDCALPHRPELTASGSNVERRGRIPACRGAFARLLDNSRHRACRWTPYIMINPICPSLAGVSPANRPARCALSPFRVVLTFRYKIRASKTA